MKATQLHDLGRSVWLDNVTRDLLSSGRVKHYLDGWSSVPLLSATLGALLIAGTLHAQNLGYEGETGVFVTPLAYTAASPANNLGKPVLSYHFLDHESVVGTFSNFSITAGAFGRLEFGYTRNVHTAGSDPTLSPLWHNGFNIFHGKVNIFRENTAKRNWIPAISVGFLIRTQVHNVGGAIANQDTVNGDIYLVATKMITQLKRLPIIINGGVRGTNAELWGIAGNAPSFQARAFGAAGFVLKGPYKSTFTLSSEVAQQPRHPEGLPSASIPTTITYAVRVAPLHDRKFNVDFGVAQVAGHITPSADLKSRHLFAIGISYGF